MQDNEILNKWLADEEVQIQREARRAGFFAAFTILSMIGLLFYVNANL